MTMTSTRGPSRVTLSSNRLAIAAFTLLLLLLLLAIPRAASAKATFVVNNLDGPGVGFNDPTPAPPVGGNSGTTLGQQRQLAFKYAADLWGAALDSPIPIVIDAMFAPLDCGTGIIMLGHARAQNLFASVAPNNIIPGLPMNVLYPEPLADRLAGMDLEPGVADIVATFNGGLHDCDPSIDWYYGLDAKAGSLTDLVEVVVHELGHGLGFSSGVDVSTGALDIGLADAFTAHIYDNAMGLAWLDMSDAQRLASMRNVRHLVWTGDNAIRAAAQVLSKGAPTLTAQPVISAFVGNLGETNFGPLVKDVTTTLTGPLIIGNPTSGCTPLAPASGGIVLLDGNSPCSPLNQADYATRAGAIAVLLTDLNQFSPPSSVELPPSQLSILQVHIPVVALTVADGDRLSSAGSSFTLSLASDNTRLTGTDAMGRPYLYASDPVRPGSTVSHWDPLSRPDLIEEPEAGYEHPHDITMEAALMRDIGWATSCGDGMLDTGEQCDNGNDNSDTTPDACRSTCLRAHCGDGIKDTGEACDQGSQNGAAGSTCSATCTMMVTPPHPDAGGGSVGGNAGGMGTGGSAGTTGGNGGFSGGGNGCACALEPSTGTQFANLVALALALALGMTGRRARRR